MKSVNGEKPMNTHKSKKHNHSTKNFHLRDAKKRRVLSDRIIKTIFGGLIGMGLTTLFSVVIVAFVVKAFVSSEQMSFQLLNAAITIVGTTLGAVLGYVLGRNSGDRT
jgi:hypothetical protein